MTREQVEKGLRRHLLSMGPPSSGLMIVNVHDATRTLLPWIMELLEEAEITARLDEGRLP